MNLLKSSIEHLLVVIRMQNLQEYHSAYDACLWRITTSGKSELEEFVKDAWNEPYCKLPVPLLVLMCRLYVLQSEEFTIEVKNAMDFIIVHCTPREEKGATQGFSRLRV